MPDENKFEKLRSIGYRIPITCGLCIHGPWPAEVWGTCSLQREIIKEVIKRMTDEDWKDLKGQLLVKAKAQIRDTLPDAVQNQLRQWVQVEASKGVSGERWGKVQSTTTKTVDKVLEELTSEESLRQVIAPLAGPKIQQIVTEQVRQQLRTLR